MSVGVGLAITVALLAVNAFFVAGEFAVTSTRRSQVEPLADEGARGASAALFALRHVSLMLAICQLGVTVASTTLGVVAEPAIAHLVESPLERLGAPEAT
ncbi:MAG: CNNM domain-containing protein, partial [Pauljensenia sp.]|nr:CNNM domain-containing protein [Pauljensenia sp.]